MRYLRFISIFLFFLFALGLIGVDQAQGDEPTSGLTGVGQARGGGQTSGFTPEIVWTLDDIDTTGNVGQFASLAIHPQTDLPHLSYYDATTGDLRRAYNTNNPINTPCLVNDWECITWNTSGTDGSFTAMALRNNGNYGILYLNESQDKLYLRGDQGDGIPHANNVIDSVGNPGRASHNLEYDRFGVPHAIYVRESVDYDSVRYAKYVGSGGNCENVAWQCEIIITGYSGGPLSTSLGLTYYGAPRLAIGNSSGLMYARRSPSNDICGPYWTCDQIEAGIAVASVALYQPSCQIICSSPVMIAYYDLSNGRLKFATSVESGGNCGVGNQAGKWQCDIIETIGINGTYRVSLATYTYQQPLIAYTDGDDRANTTLKVAYQNVGGNCGPLQNGTGTWQCDTIDTGLRFVGGFPFFHDVGSFPSVDINSDWTMYIAYYDSDAGDLRVATGDPDGSPPPPPSASFYSYIPAVFR